MRERVLVTGVAVASALGRGPEAQLSPTPAFAPVRRFDVSRRRVGIAATIQDAATLPEELAEAIAHACSGLDAVELAATPLLLAVHADPGALLANTLALGAGLAAPHRVYTSACVSASTAIADAATRIRQGRAERVVVAAGYLVESDQYALFDAGKSLATDGTARPFSAGRTGLLLGDGVAAVLLEAESVARSVAHGNEPLAEIAGWGRAGDAYHPVQPHPDGRGLAAAITAALAVAGVDPADIGYVNANATGTEHSDPAEAAALAATLGPVPVSSTKSVHGHALEASGLLELVVTVQAMREGKLPVNAGFTEPDPRCPVDVITDAPRRAGTPYALSLNSAFGGACTALLVRAV